MLFIVIVQNDNGEWVFVAAFPSFPAATEFARARHAASGYTFRYIFHVIIWPTE